MDIDRIGAIDGRDTTVSETIEWVYVSINFLLLDQRCRL